MERAGRRDMALRRKEEEFIETLQGADDEGEAQQLLRRHVERAVPGASAVVLTRNDSGDHLSASTDATAIDGLAPRLETATPRDCLAVRRGAPYVRGDGEAPLQPCAICGDLPGVSRCTPSLVGGEVIGSLLVTRGRRLGERRVETISSAVNQAAPVLAAVGAAVAATVRASDFAGHWGGEEFLVLLPDTGLEGATLLAEKLRAAIATIEVPGVPGRITASAGVAVVPDHAADAGELLRAADRALCDSAAAATAGSR